MAPMMTSLSLFLSLSRYHNLSPENIAPSSLRHHFLGCRMSIDGVCRARFLHRHHPFLPFGAHFVKGPLPLLLSILLLLVETHIHVNQRGQRQRAIPFRRDLSSPPSAIAFGRRTVTRH